VDLVSESELSRLFHRLNNQLGVILANAELLESRLSDETQRARASQIVAGAVDAIASVQGLRRLLTPENERNPGLTPSAS
jgi:nitrogen-specific signal transduction histidine kinase